MPSVVKSVVEFKAFIEKPLLTVVDFHATWCGPCKIISPKFEEFSKKYTDAQFIKVDVDELPDVAGSCDIRAMPTFQLYNAGKKLGEIVGADARKLEDLIAKNHSPV